MILYLSRESEQRIIAASSPQDVSEEMLLSIVSRENGDLLGRIAQSPHVHESGDDELSFGQVLIEMRIRLGFTDAVEVANVDYLSWNDDNDDDNDNDDDDT